MGTTQHSEGLHKKKKDDSALSFRFRITRCPSESLRFLKTRTKKQKSQIVAHEDCCVSKPTLTRSLQNLLLHQLRH